LAQQFLDAGSHLFALAPQIVEFLGEMLDLLAQFVPLILELLSSRLEFAARAVGRFQLILQCLEVLLHLRILVA